MPRRYTDSEVEARMVPQIVEAIYPVLIPMEQQDCRIQAENHAAMTKIATLIWRLFTSDDERAKQMVHDALGTHEQSTRKIGGPDGAR